MYNFAGSAYNFDLVSDAIGALLNILFAGDMEVEQSIHENPYIGYFDTTGIGYMGAFLTLLKSAPKQVVNAWRVEADQFTIEDRIKGYVYYFMNETSMYY